MLRRSLTTLGLTAVLAASAQADWKITTAVTANGHCSTGTEYFKGKLRRTDQDKHVSVTDFERLRYIIWSPELRQYVVIRLRREYRGFAGHPIIVEQHTTDTGEHRIVFGRVAHHF